MGAETIPAETVALLDYDPELGRDLAPARLEQARATALATMVRLPRAGWTVAALADRCPYGVLVLDGLLSREVDLDDTTSMQLFGRGDLVHPRADVGERLVETEVRWQVLEPAAIALLDERFLMAVRRWPEIVAALFARLAEQVARGAVQCALCQLPRVEDRVHALLWFLAERWGRVTPDGVVLPLRLTHAALGRLVGAKRPTVSLAIKALDARGVVGRRSDGAWMLREPPSLLAPAPEPASSTGGFVGREPSFAQRPIVAADAAAAREREHAARGR